MPTKPLKAVEPLKSEKDSTASRRLSREKDHEVQSGKSNSSNHNIKAGDPEVSTTESTSSAQTLKTKSVKKAPIETKNTAKPNKKADAKPVVPSEDQANSQDNTESAGKAVLKSGSGNGVAKPEESKTESKAAAVKAAGKQVIVPNKPAINPKPVSDKKEESSASGPVVVPKTSTTKMVDYAPEFTKSVLDSPAQAPLKPTMRYSDVELNEFRELINKKLEAAKKELAYLQGLITRKDEMGGDESDNRYMTMEDGSMSMEREQLSQMASRQITFIDHLEKAIMRIENKTYGICRVTGKLIDKARLRAVPHATLSMEAKLGIVK
ncbi:TraR/DksA family transcriptional regulator [Segetibacter sp. 3557_3]|uniref:TraR/DksA family transcriptional regulator n=1 Tax=Segetibacter sp. 3557_3 TaxID=2547429 RepID=UPI001FB60529|nr:TraR/DksA C4-type zinc finger protein [Segetibacter sp. 3557_3]